MKTGLQAGLAAARHLVTHHPVSRILAGTMVGTKFDGELCMARKAKELRPLAVSRLAELRVQPWVHAHPVGHGRRMLRLDFVENARSRLLDQQLIGEAERDESKVQLKCHLEDPETLVLSSVFISLGVAHRSGHGCRLVASGTDRLHVGANSCGVSVQIEVLDID